MHRTGCPRSTSAMRRLKMTIDTTYYPANPHKLLVKLIYQALHKGRKSLGMSKKTIHNRIEQTYHCKLGAKFEKELLRALKRLVRSHHLEKKGYRYKISKSTPHGQGWRLNDSLPVACKCKALTSGGRPGSRSGSRARGCVCPSRTSCSSRCRCPSECTTHKGGYRSIHPRCSSSRSRSRSRIRRSLGVKRPKKDRRRRWGRKKQGRRKGRQRRWGHSRGGRRQGKSRSRLRAQSSLQGKLRSRSRARSSSRGKSRSRSRSRARSSRSRSRSRSRCCQRRTFSYRSQSGSRKRGRSLTRRTRTTRVSRSQTRSTSRSVKRRRIVYSSRSVSRSGSASASAVSSPRSVVVPVPKLDAKRGVFEPGLVPAISTGASSSRRVASAYYSSENHNHSPARSRAGRSPSRRGPSARSSSVPDRSRSRSPSLAPSHRSALPSLPFLKPTKPALRQSRPQSPLSPISPQSDAALTPKSMVKFLTE